MEIDPDGIGRNRLDRPQQQRSGAVQFTLGGVDGAIDREPGVQGPEAGDPWVELVRSDRVVLFCILCGNELGPKPVQPVVMFPDSPRPSALGHACVGCLRAHAFALADAIEDHVEWLTGVAADLTRIARLARIGQFRRPSVADWHTANEIGLGGSNVLE